MKIVKIYEDEYNLVESFLQKNFSSPTHWPGWNELMHYSFKTEFFYFAAYDKEELVGICPAHEEKGTLLTDIFSGQFNYIPYGGWIFSKKINFSNKDLPLIYNESFQSFSLPLLPEFNAEYNDKGRDFLTLVIDLEKEIEEIWMNEVNSKRRNMIRKAEKSNIEILVNPLNRMQEFYDIYNNFNKKNHLRSLPFSFFEKIEKTKNTKFDIIWAQHENKVIGITVIAYDKNYAIYWLGIYPEDSPSLGQGEMLQWEAIKRMKTNGCKYYDLCYIEKDRLPHIYKFKSGFTQNEVSVPFVKIKPLSYKITNKIRKSFGIK